MKNQKLNLLFITHYSGMYGANKSMCRLMLELRENHNVVPFVVMRSDGPICEFLNENKIPYLVSHFYWWVYEGKGIKKWVLNFIKQIRNYSKISKIYNQIKNQSIDLIYTNSIVINIGVLLSKKIGCPHLWHIRETLQAYGFKFSLGKRLSKSILRKGAQKYVVISDYLNVWYSNLLPTQKVIRIYNGVEPEIPLRENNSINTTLNLCIIGILCDQKNQLEALKALDILVHSKGIDILRLHLIGAKRDDYYSLLTKFISEKRLENYVQFHGHSNEVNQLLKDMNLGIVCARDEGFGRVSVEFMHSRMPVIASISGANAELIITGLNGETYPLSDYHQLADKIEEYVKEPNLVEILGAKAQKYALDNFPSTKNTQAIARVIHELVEKK